jgi:hypothetical protein
MIFSDIFWGVTVSERDGGGRRKNKNKLEIGASTFWFAFVVLDLNFGFFIFFEFVFNGYTKKALAGFSWRAGGAEGSGRQFLHPPSGTKPANVFLYTRCTQKPKTMKFPKFRSTTKVAKKDFFL